MASPVIPSKVAPIRALSRSSLSVDTGPSAIVVTGRSGPGRWPATASRMCWSPAPRTMCAPTLAAASETRAAMDAAFRSPPASGSLLVTCRSPWCCAGGRSGWVSRRSSRVSTVAASMVTGPTVRSAALFVPAWPLPASRWPAMRPATRSPTPNTRPMVSGLIPDYDGISGDASPFCIQFACRSCRRGAVDVR